MCVCVTEVKKITHFELNLEKKGVMPETTRVTDLIDKSIDICLCQVCGHTAASFDGSVQYRLIFLGRFSCLLQHGF